MLSGIAMGIAQAMGLHRDGADFSLGKIETEVRRRLWWSLCQLDIRISGDYGLEPHIPLTWNTQLPIHINDSDLDTVKQQRMIPRTEFCDMTISLIKLEMAKTSLRFTRAHCETPPLSKEAAADLVREQIRRYENNILPVLDVSDQLHRLCYLGIWLIMNKLSRMTFEGATGSEVIPHEDMKDRLMLYNSDILEIAHQLPDKSHRFGWFFGCRYSQWHAMAYILVGLCKYPRGPSVDRAWAVLDVIFSDPKREDHQNAKETTDSQKGSTKDLLWRPLVNLHRRAQDVRKQSLRAFPEVESVSPYTPLNSSPHYLIDGPTREKNPEALSEHDVSSDPFLGFTPNFSDDMKLDELESWIQYVHEEYILDPESMDHQTEPLSI